ncbi:MAG: hypothetical protein NTX59_11260 [Elusimicrobia bacterium]|nr:hypothetical protein [Elusimicrobiota bacterium]
MKLNIRPIAASLACIVLLAATCRYFVAQLRIYLDLWSLTMVVGGTSLFLVINFSIKEIIQAFKFVIMPAYESSEEKYLQAVHVFDTGSRAALAFGAIGFLMGIMGLLAELHKPEFIGPLTEITLLNVLYALILSEVFFKGLKIQCERGNFL